MAVRRSTLVIQALSILLTLSACTKFGHVNQGRVIDYDAQKGLVTLIQDSNYMEPSKPRFDVLPPLTVRVPVDRAEMGPAPHAGKLLSLDLVKGRAVIFDAATQSLRTIACTPLSQVAKVAASDARVAKAKLPVVDRQKKTILTYSPAEQRLVTFSVADEYLELPEDTWVIGDEIRYYYKEPGQALRMMNVTKTDLSKGK